MRTTNTRGLIAILPLVLLILPGQARADGQPVIVSPLNCEHVTSPVRVIVSSASEHGAVDGQAKDPGSHLHLIVDGPLPAPGHLIPMDARHFHLMHGETKLTLKLPPGQHTLQLLEGTRGHRVTDTPNASALVTITVD